MRPYSVLLVSPFPPPYGGIASYSGNLYHGLAAQAVPVERYDTSRQERLRLHNPDKKRNYARILHPANLLFLLAILFDFVRFFFTILFKRKLIIHVHTSSFLGWWRSAVFVAIGRLLGKKTILHVHNAIDRFYSQDSGTLAKFFIRLSLRLPDALITLSDGIKNLVSQLTGKPVQPIYNGVDVEQFESEKIYTRPARILFAGFVGPHKGVPDLLRAVKASVLTPDQATLTIMGIGDLDEMRQLAESLGIQSQVTFTGRVSEPEKLDLFKTHHILALPSHGEGQPIAILEGLAAGMAILSTTVGSIPEVVKEDNGVLVTPGDVEALARGLGRLVDGALETMGRTNRQLARDRFRFSRVVTDNMDVYDRVAAS